jgi:VWFA-related protein
MADLIVNHNDPSALNTAAADAIQCASLVTPATLTQGSVVTVTPQNQQQAVNMAQSAASRSLALGEAETQQALGVLKDVIRRMSLTPGLRSIVLISPGFLINTNYRQDEADLMDRAVRANVTINTLDPRGLYVPSSVADASKSQYNSRTAVAQDRFLRESELAEQDTIAELAEGTGGTFFHNSNDYAEGLKQTAAAPEYIYLLGFSPQNLKYDGSFHGVKVTLKPKDLSMQARRGYYAPRHAANEEEQAKQEIKEAMFSREEVQEFPIQLQSQFFKVTPDRAKLAIVAHIDLKLLKFQKMEGRDKDTLTIVSGLFDRNGNMLAGTTKTVEMRLKEENFANHLANGLNVKTSFDVQPGKYLLRLVVRDSEGQMMSARNGIVDIP